MNENFLRQDYWNTFYRNQNDWGQPRSQILEIVKELQKTFAKSEIHILELACGNGRYTIPFAELGARVDCVDFSEIAIAQLRNRAMERGVADQIRSFCGDVRGFSIEPSQYHLVTASGLFEYLDETELRVLISVVQTGTAIRGVNAFVWLLQHPEGTTVPGEHPLGPGIVEEIYESSPTWAIVSSEAYFKDDFHPLVEGGKPQEHKHYIGRMVAKRSGN